MHVRWHEPSALTGGQPLGRRAERRGIGCLEGTTVRPAFFISSIDLASSAGTRLLTFSSMLRAARSTTSRSCGEMACHADSLMSVAPTSGATGTSSMYGASPNSRVATANTGGLGVALMAPVGNLSCLGISPPAAAPP